jgi:hypothetical protein
MQVYDPHDDDGESRNAGKRGDYAAVTLVVIAALFTFSLALAIVS